jgi:putative transferase (TIGR04331 family)
VENNIKYLSTTSILPNEVLDKVIVFISKSVVPESSQLRLEDVNYEVLPDIWNDHKKLKEGSDYLERLYGTLVKKFGFALNKLHNVDYPDSFWELPMASWLLYFLHPTFDRYCRLKLAIELYGKENLVLLAHKHKVGTYPGYPDFIENVCVNEQYVSAFYAEVAMQMGLQVREFTSNESFRGRVIVGPKKFNLLSGSFYVRVYQKLKKMIWDLILLSLFEKNNVLMEQYKFSGWEKLVFVKKLDASFLPWKKMKIAGLKKIDRDILLSISANDQFEKIVIDLLPKFMPEYLLEDFEAYVQEAEKYSRFKSYFFVNSYISNILFTYAASLGKVKGAKIIACQHGFGYGQYENSSCEVVERSFSDYYITWGWCDCRYPKAQILPLPQPNIYKLMNKHKTKLDIVIWVSNAIPRHVFRFGPYPFMPDMIPLYFSCKRKFVGALDSDIRNYVVYRPYQYDYGWFEEEKNLLEEQNIRTEYSGTLPALLQKVKLYICDHLSTSCMEALVANTPSVFFWDYELCREREDAKPAFDLLRKAGILFNDPIDAANNVNSIWEDVQGWWMEPKRQEARTKFMEKFCWADPHWQERWVDAFKEIAR